jgi:hypothetical protein
VSRSSTGLSIAAGLALVACATLVLGLAVIGGINQGSTSASVVTVAELAAETCTVSGPVKGLTAEQAANADAIVSTTMSASDENTRAARIALMTAITESELYNLDHGEQDSLGLFQQRPSQGWGTPAQLMDPVYATDAFVRRLLSVPNWQKIAPWLAAQDVQHSADSDGSNYEANWGGPAGILADVLAKGAPGSLRSGHRRARRHRDRARPAAGLRRPGRARRPSTPRSSELRPRPARQALCVGRGRAGRLRLLGADHGCLGDGRSHLGARLQHPADRGRSRHGGSARARRPRARAGLGLTGAGPRRPRRHLPR